MYDNLEVLFPNMKVTHDYLPPLEPILWRLGTKIYPVVDQGGGGGAMGARAPPPLPSSGPNYDKTCASATSLKSLIKPLLTYP